VSLFGSASPSLIAPSPCRQAGGQWPGESAARYFSSRVLARGGGISILVNPADSQARQKMTSRRFCVGLGIRPNVIPWQIAPTIRQFRPDHGPCPDVGVRGAQGVRRLWTGPRPLRAFPDGSGHCSACGRHITGQALHDGMHIRANPICFRCWELCGRGPRPGPICFRRPSTRMT